MKQHSRSFMDSVRDACAGIVYTWKSERNFRIEIGFAVVALSGMFFVPLTHGERFGIVLAICAVLSAELFNTAIERTVDVATTAKNPLAGAAKDAAAASVLIVSIGAAIYGCVLLGTVINRLAYMM